MTPTSQTTLHSKFWRGPGSIGILLAALLSQALPASAAVDEAINKGIWRLLYQATEAQVNSPSWLAGDDDGDGLSNKAELNAGTNPFNNSSAVRVTALSTSATNVSLTFPTVTGKSYSVQASQTLSPASWVSLNPVVQVIGDGTSKTLLAPRSAGTFFRVLVQDSDNDNDSVSDWAEQVVGLDPVIATSNGNLDGNGLPISDGAFATAELAAQGKVGISAVDALAMQPASGQQPAPALGKFRITRRGFTRFLPAGVVSFNVGGTALSGTDYQSLPTSRSFLANEVSKEVSVTPLFNGNRRNSVSVVATLQTSPNYTIQGQGWAAVIIQPTNAAIGSGLLARYYDTSAYNYADAANFGQAGTYSFTRNASPDTSGSIVVSYTSGNLSALQPGHSVKLSFSSGNLNNALYTHQSYTVTAVTASSFTASIFGAATLPTSGTGNCHFSIQSFPHPGVVERVDPTVDFDLAVGTPNGVDYAPNGSTDHFSSVWEAYLHPSTAGAYQFQLDADDKARVLLDRNDGNGLQQILEHGWDSAATVGTFKQSAAYNLAVPANPAGRYRIRVEYVESTGSARCRLQWRAGSGSFANIPQANVFTHSSAATYAFTRASATDGTATISLNGHGLIAGNSVTVAFSANNLFQPVSYSGTFTVASATTNTFTIPITGTNLPANVSAGQACHILNRPASTTTGLLNQIYANTTFTAPAGRVAVDAAITSSADGIWGEGSPAAGQIHPETFSVRWTGQVQPQFSEEYTLIVNANDGSALRINGELMALKTAPAGTTYGSTYSYNTTTGDVVVTYSGLPVASGSYAVGETVFVYPADGNLNHGTGSTYTYNGGTGEAVINYSAMTNINPGGFVVGETVQLDPTSGSLNSLGTDKYVITAATPTTFTVNFGTGDFPTGNGTMTISDYRDAVVTAATPTSFTFNIGAGKYATGTGNINVEIVNKDLKDWTYVASDRYVRIPMVGGTRYDIQLDAYEGTGNARAQLSWFSASQPKQIIPSNRLYPSNAPQAAGSLTSDTTGNALVGGLYSHTITGSNGGTISISGAPSWLTLNGDVLSGTPPAGAGGDYQILITITNANGTSTSVLNLHVDQNTATVAREVWNSVSGSGVAAIPVNSTPSVVTTLTKLQSLTNAGDNYGERIRGYIMAPATGNYYFWLAASDAAELWISNDNEPVNKLRRAASTAGSATPLDWNNAAKSPWLALEAGKKYYFEILHKVGTGNDHLAIGWLKPGQAGTTPSEIVPGPVLSPYYNTPALANPGTLYLATLLSQGGAETTGSGSSTLRLSADETTATMRYSYSGLTGPLTSQHIHSDPYLGHPATILFDIDDPVTAGDGLQPDGSYKWTIAPVGTLSAADIREIIKQGKAYINLHTAAYPNGEIRGNYTLALGSRTFTPPPAAPAWTSDHQTNAGAARFLHQATFGASIADIAALKAMPSYDAWINDQFTKPASKQLPEVLERELSNASGSGEFNESLTFNAWWRNSVTAPDQLRQRVAFALSQIHVVSAQGPLDARADALSYFYDKLAENAFGNFRDILEDTTLTPSMGRYLDMLRNDKPDLAVGRIPNENYAREIKQLFSIGLYRLWPDGSLILNSKDSPIETYTQREIVGLAHVFTGWDYGYDGSFRSSFGAATNWTRQMREVPARHFTGPKRILNNEVLPGLASSGGQALDPDSTHSSSNFNDPAYQLLPAQELDAVHDQLFNHPNVGPLICRQLIQRLVTSHPSRDYVYRVVQKFNDNGTGVRGDMKAVIKAILLDHEARSSSMAAKAEFGKQREPVLRLTAVGRAFRMESASGTYSQNGSHVINVTMPNKLVGGNTVQLEFPKSDPFTPGDSAPTSGRYTVLSTPAPTATGFSVNATGWIGIDGGNGTANGGTTGTYTQAEGSNVITVTLGSHWLNAGGKAWLDFVVATSGTEMPDGMYIAQTSTSTGNTTSGTTFTITAPDTNARSGRVRIARFMGTFAVSDSYLPAPQNKRITLDTTSVYSNVDHHLNVGDRVYLNINGGNPQPPDGEFIVESVPDPNTFTVLTTGISNQGTNGAAMFPLAGQPLTRSGTLGAPPSTFDMGNTNADLEQSPLNSPTVFNYFLPDYKFAGALAARGMTTPEFQITSETAVIRQANFIYNGLFNPGNTNGISSFRSGSNALVLDFSQWMGNATDFGLGAGPQTGQPWTSNANLASLIDKLQSLLIAGQLSPEAKTVIQNFLLKPINSVSTGNPATITSPGHGLATGDSIVISGVTGGTTINGTRVVTVVDGNTFTIPVNVTTAPTAAQLASAHYSVVSYDNTAPTDAQKRDRLRTILHFLITSPDFTIQR